MPVKHPYHENESRNYDKRLKMSNILVVDTDTSFVQAIEGYLQSAGLQMHHAGDSYTAQSLVKQMRVDVALINVGLLNPLDNRDYSGIDLAINLQGYTRCIMMADNPTVDMVRGALAPRLDRPAPAYDFFGKDWSIHRILTLITSVLNMPVDTVIVHPETDGNVHYGMTWHPNSTEFFKLDLNRHLVIVDDEEINLSEREYRIVLYMMDHPEKIVSRKEIVVRIFEEVYDHTMDRNRINNIISRLRKKIEDDPHCPSYLVTSWGKGWLLYPDGRVPEVFKRKP